MTSFLCDDSFTYVLRIIILDVSETAREKARRNNNDLSHVPSDRQQEIKSGTSDCHWLVCCSLLPTCYFHRPFTIKYLIGNL